MRRAVALKARGMELLTMLLKKNPTNTRGGGDSGSTKETTPRHFSQGTGMSPIRQATLGGMIAAHDEGEGEPDLRLHAASILHKSILFPSVEMSLPRILLKVKHLR